MQAARALWSYRGIGDTGNMILVIASLAIGPTLLLYGQWTGWLFIAAAAIFAALTLLRNVIWRRAYRKMRKYTAPITATLTQTTVGVVSAEGENTLPWSSFANYAETPAFYFLFGARAIGRRSLSIIPKSAFASDLENEQARVYIATNLKRKKMRWT